MSIRHAFIFVCTLAACGEPSGDDTDGDVGSTGESSGSSGTTGEAAACAEDDFMAMPFAGPGYDAEKGGLQAPLQDAYVASSTFAAIRPERQEEFLALAQAMVPVLMANQGLVGYAFGNSVKCGTARTLTVWRDEAAMMRFVTSDEHVAGMAKATELTYTGTVLSWSVGRAAVPVEWDDAVARVTATPASY